MTETLAPRSRKVKILATLGPASSDPEMIRKLMLAGADAFRINMSHGDQSEKAALVDAIRALEKELRRPTTILFDLQGPKLRVGKFKGGAAEVEAGQTFTFDRDRKLGGPDRVQLPHPELFEAIRPGDRILINDGKVRLKAIEVSDRAIVTEVQVGGKLSDNKGVNVPDVLVPIPALTDKDRADLEFALEQKADWIALSFVQRPEDVAEARALIGDKAALLAKIEKPAAIDQLERHHRSVRRGDGRARRPRRRASARAGAAAAEPDHRRGAPLRQAGGGRDPDARIDDQLAEPDPGRGQRCRHRDLRRRRRGDAVGGKRRRRLSVRGGGDDGPDRARAPSATRSIRRGFTSPRPGSSRPPPTRLPARRGTSR